jgi:cell division GTPase FtsZ
MAKEGNNEPESDLDAVEKPEEHVEPQKPSFNKPTIICIGEYPIKILLRGSLAEKKDEPLPIFIDKFSKDIAEWSQSSLNPDNILGLDLNIDTHFWFQVLPCIENDGALMARLKDKSADNLRGAVIVSSLWDGVGSGLLPALISQFKEWNTNTVAFGVLPSQMQISDVHFNAFSSIGMCVSKGFASLLLLDRDQLESYVGVDRNGSVLKGNEIINYLLEVVSAKETFVQELSELSRAFDVRMYTVLSATGASFSMYGSIKNILNSALSRPLLKFDLSSASVVYVLLRLPLQLKEKLSRGKIELEIANWFKEKASLKSLFISEPVYVEDANDRVDVVVFVGGFDVTKMFSLMEKKVRPIKSFVVKKGSIKEDEWRDIVKSLGAD